MYVGPYMTHLRIMGASPNYFGKDLTLAGGGGGGGGQWRGGQGGPGDPGPPCGAKMIGRRNTRGRQ